jgi:hypothetical protein
VVDAAELGDDDRLDAVAEVGGQLRVGDLVGADALAVVLDEDVGQLAGGEVAVALAGLAGEVRSTPRSAATSSGLRWALR